jgi:hypothetical protein
MSSGAETIGPASAGNGNEKPTPASLVHELSEALTAIGNYLTAAKRMLDGEADPPGATVPEVLERSLVQLSRAVEALRQIRTSMP